MEDLQKAIENIEMAHFEQPLLIWTDYEMFNETHFWSNTGQNWWSKLDYQDSEYNEWLTFRSTVMFDGYKKFRNFKPPIDGVCICVINRALKWPFKCLMVFFAASFVFALTGKFLRSRCQRRHTK